MSLIEIQCPVTVTPAASAHMVSIIEEKHIDLAKYGLRVGIRGSGCGGAAPLLGFDTSTPSDQCYLLGTFRLFVDKKHLMYVMGLEIDYQDTEEAQGFVFNQPPGM